MGIYDMAGSRELKRMIEKIQKSLSNLKGRPPSVALSYQIKV
jgi:hypothetical protein